jgi:hypothetical protein
MSLNDTLEKKHVQNNAKVKNITDTIIIYRNYIILIIQHQWYNISSLKQYKNQVYILSSSYIPNILSSH